MTPPGMAFTFVGDRALAARVRCASPYWDWNPRLSPEVYYQPSPARRRPTISTACAARSTMILEEEGLEAVWRRHAVLAGAVWAAVEAWGDGRVVPAQHRRAAIRSHAVTTIRTAPGEGTRLRRWCADAAGVTLGVGLPAPGIDPEGLFRIGHMGHLNPPTLLGTLATVEAGLRALGDPARAGRARGRGGGRRGGGATQPR